MTSRMVDPEERYMVGLTCFVPGCKFDTLTPRVTAMAEGAPDPEVEAMRAHLVSHSPHELADVILNPYRFAGRQWRTTYRLVRENGQ